MSRKKAPFKSYEGLKQNDKHIRITDSMMMSKPYLALSSNAKVLYSYMKLWACGREEFEYTVALSSKIMSPNTFLKARNELVNNRFYRNCKYW